VVTQAPQAQPRFLTAKQVSEITGLGLQTVYDKIKQGILPGRQVGGKKGRYVVPEASLLRYLEGDWAGEEGGGGQ
jgi:excisionase family DNA binding protein